MVRRGVMGVLAFQSRHAWVGKDWSTADFEHEGLCRQQTFRRGVLVDGLVGQQKFCVGVENVEQSAPGHVGLAPSFVPFGRVHVARAED